MENKFRRVNEMNVCNVAVVTYDDKASIVLTDTGSAIVERTAYYVGVPVIYVNNGKRIVSLVTWRAPEGSQIAMTHRVISSGLNIAITKKDANLLKKHNLLHLVNRYVIIDDVPQAMEYIAKIQTLVANKVAIQRYIKGGIASDTQIANLKFSIDLQRIIERYDYRNNKWMGQLPLGCLQSLTSADKRIIELGNINDDIKESDGWWAGVELETLYDYEDFLTLGKKTITKQLKHRICYRCERDGSLGDSGYEFISPAYFHGKGLVKFISHFTNEKQNDPMGKCGMHLHYSSLWLYNNAKHHAVFFAVVNELLEKINVADFFGRNYCDYATKISNIGNIGRYCCVTECDKGHFEMRLGKSTNSVEANAQIVLNMLSLLRQAEKKTKQLVEVCRTVSLIKLK